MPSSVTRSLYKGENLRLGTALVSGDYRAFQLSVAIFGVDIPLAAEVRGLLQSQWFAEV